MGRLEHLFRGLGANQCRSKLKGRAMRLFYLALLLTSCGYRLGRTPAESMVLGDVALESAEPGLREALTSAIALEGARRAVLGEGLLLSTTVVEAGSRPLSPGGGLRQAELALRFELEGERCVELRGQRTFRGGADPYAELASREAAFADLAGSLVAEGLGRLLASPEPPKCL